MGRSHRSQRANLPPTPVAVPVPNERRAAGDIIGVIIGRQAEFSKSNRRIAEAILSEPFRFVEKPIEELTAWLHVSAPTVTRFARSVGCDGLKDLKLKIMGSVRVGIRYLEPAGLPNSIAEVADRVCNRAKSVISEVRHKLDLARVEPIIELISKCQTLYAFGSGGVSSWLTEEIQNRLFRLGIRVIPCCDHQMQLMLASTVDRADVILCCSLSGANAELERAVSVAREYGARTIALTISGSTLAAAVDYLLPIDTEADKEILGPTSFRYAFLVVIDLISYGVAIHRREAGREKLRRLKQQFANLRGNDDTQPLCD
jgi:DNA-binding MurR/RpiR family transcriptional regulator